MATLLLLYLMEMNPKLFFQNIIIECFSFEYIVKFCLLKFTFKSITVHF